MLSYKMSTGGNLRSRFLCIVNTYIYTNHFLIFQGFNLLWYTHEINFFYDVCKIMHFTVCVKYNQYNLNTTVVYKINDF